MSVAISGKRHGLLVIYGVAASVLGAFLLGGSLMFLLDLGRDAPVGKDSFEYPLLWLVELILLRHVRLKAWKASQEHRKPAQWCLWLHHAATRAAVVVAVLVVIAGLSTIDSPFDLLWISIWALVGALAVAGLHRVRGDPTPTEAT